MKLSKVDKIAVLLICLSLIVGIYTMYGRYAVEKQYDTAEIMLDYMEMENISLSSEKDLNWWLDKFKQFGSRSVAIGEETINTLIESGKPLKAQIVSELIKQDNWIENYDEKIVSSIENEKIDLYDVVVTTKNETLYNYIKKGLEDRYSQELFESYYSNGSYYFVLNGSRDDLYFSGVERVVDIQGKGVYEKNRIIDSRLLNIGIGYDEEKISYVKASGLDVVLRPINFVKDNSKLTDAYIKANESFGIKPRIYLVNGKEVLGYPENEDKFLSFIKQNNISIGMIESSNQREHIVQKGLEELVEKSGFSSIRVFTMWDYIRERNKYYNYSGAQEIENTMFRAITERNIRLIYFKPFFLEKGSREYLTSIEEYERTFESLSSRLNDHDITLGKVIPIEEFHIGTKRLSVISLGIVLASAFLFNKIFKLKEKNAVIVYLLALPLSIVPFVARNLAEKGFAFVAAVVFAGLGIFYFTSCIKNIFDSKKELSIKDIIIKSTIVLTISVLISLVGAVFLVSMLSDVKYLLEMDIFRGVKLSQLLPFAIFLVLYLLYFYSDKKEDPLKSIYELIKSILMIDIKVYYVAIATTLGAIAYVYISRTGHETNLEPSNIEMIARNFMEYVLVARPRTKEFLIAFPAIYASVYFANKKTKFFTGVFMLLAAIGSSSILNTFSHIRTPLFLSFARTVIALGFGIVIGIIFVIIIDLFYRLYVKMQERFNWEKYCWQDFTAMATWETKQY